MSHSLLCRQSQGYNQVPVTPELPSQPRRRSGVRKADLVGATNKRSEAGAPGYVSGTGAGVGESGQRSGLVSGDRRSWGWHQAFNARPASSEGQDWEQESQEEEGQGKGGVCGAGRAGGWGEAAKLVFPSGVKTAAEK